MTCINTCMGYVVGDLCKIKLSYKQLICCIEKSINKLTELNDDILLTPAVSDMNKKKYQKIIRKLRCCIDDTICNNCLEDIRCIPTKSYEIILKIKCKDMNITIPCFVPLFFLQKADTCGELLYYGVDPNIVPYNIAIQSVIGYKDIIDGVYPVWYFKEQSLITTNDTQIAEVSGDPDLTYFELFDKRAMVYEEYYNDGKKSVKAYGKYKFCYKKNESFLELFDPSNPSEHISPNLQGIINGIYSFASSIDMYDTSAEASLAIQNTISVLQQLIIYINMFIKELDTFIKGLCDC